MNNVQDRLPILSGVNLTGPQNGDEFAPWNAASTQPLPDGDRVNRLPKPFNGFGTGFGDGFTGMQIVQQLLSLISQLLSMFGMGRFFQDANASSTGDPHLAFNGTAPNGQNVQTRFDSMTAHSNLLDSDSFLGGYRVSTSVTQPGANGVTYNQRAVVSTGYGQTEVSLDNAGDAYVVQNGRQFSLASGHSYDAGNGETVIRNTDGSVLVTDTNAQGGTIATTLSKSAHGVDVRTQAQNVDLFGDLLTSL